MFLERHHTGADHPSVGTALRGRDRDALETCGECARTRLLEGHIDEQVVVRCAEAPADHDVLGLEDVHERGEADAQPAAELVQMPERLLVARARGALDLAPGAARDALERAAGAVRLEATPVRARAARARPAIGLDDHVTEL